MKLKSAVIIITILFMGCATQPKQRVVNPRIMYSDLVYVEDISEKQPASNLNITKSLESFPVKNIEFKNECDQVATSVQKDLVDWIKKVVAPDDMLIVLGHSHGPSAIGTDRLAIKRVENVKKIIKSNSTIENIFSLSSWGEDKKVFAPNKAVQIFLMKEFHKNRFSIVFSKDDNVKVLNSLLHKNQ